MVLSQKVERARARILINSPNRSAGRGMIPIRSSPPMPLNRQSRHLALGEKEKQMSENKSQAP
jgi:hypothetical protein